MPEIPADVHHQLTSFSIESPGLVRWVKHAPMRVKLSKGHTHWIGCRCMAGKQVKLRHIEIHRRSLGVGQCSNCHAIHWRDWDVIADSPKAGWASIIDTIE
jgi:hypothetical protein